MVCVLPSDASRNTYHLTWVSLTLDVGYLFTAAPVEHSRCSLPWTKGISTQPPLLTLSGVAPLGPPAPMKLSHAMWGHPRRTGHGGEV